MSFASRHRWRFWFLDKRVYLLVVHFFSFVQLISSGTVACEYLYYTHVHTNIQLKFNKATIEASIWKERISIEYLARKLALKSLHWNMKYI